MKRKRVLILGASLMQVSVIQATKRMGHIAITADANAFAVGKNYADEFLHVDLQNIKELIFHAQRLHIDAVLTCATDFSYAVSVIAEACSLHGISANVARRANFKDLMRKCFAEHGIASPKYQVFHCPEKTEQNRDNFLKNIDTITSKTLEFPLVLKPVDNMGARGVSLVHGTEGFSSALQLAFLHSRSDTIIVEKKLSGPELSIDSFVLKGTFYPIGIADRHIAFAPYFVEMGHTIPSKLSRELQSDALHVLEQAAAALGMTTGVCKGDIIFDDEKAYIGECAARLSGGYMSGLTIPYAYGIDPAEYAVMLALHGRLPQHVKKTLREIVPSCTVAERALITLPGTLRRIQVPKQLQHFTDTVFTFSKHESQIPTNSQIPKNQIEASFSSVRNVILNASIGRHYGLPKNNTDKVGSVIATGSTPSEAHNAAALALAQIYFDVERDDTTHAFLYSHNSRDEDKYRAWYCYSASHEIFREDVLQNLQNLTENIADCCKHNSMTVYIPDALQRSIEIGTWTHLNPFNAFVHAQTYMPIQIVSKKEKSINAIALRAFFRAGWQGLHYTLQLIQTCTTHTLKNLCILAHS